MTNPIFALIHVSFDYYKFQEVVCVSENPAKLGREFISNYWKMPLLTPEKSDSMDEKGESPAFEHYVIKELRTL